MKKQIINNTFTEIPKFLLTTVAGVMVDGEYYASIKDWAPAAKTGENIIVINPVKSTVVEIIVKEAAMKDSPFFQFNKIHNGGIPIPMTIMYGKMLEENEKMKKMDLWDKDRKVHWTGWILKSMIISEKEL